MPDEGSFTFDEPSVRRIVKSVKYTEGVTGGGSGGGRRGAPPTLDTSFLARLTTLSIGDEDTGGAYTWQAVYPKNDGTYEDVTGSNSGGEYTARAYAPDKVANAATGPTGAVVWLDFWGYDEDDKPIYLFEGGSNVVRIKVVDAGDTSGHYTANLVKLPTYDDAEGDAMTGGNVVAINRREAESGEDTHYLTDDDGSGSPTTFDAVVLRWQDDGTLLVSFDGLQSFKCVEDEESGE
jgi:hypothetical protein